MGRAAKGSVSVGADRGWLRLRWRHRGQAYTMMVGLPDDPVNQALAQQTAQQIESDLRADRIAPGAFDAILAKYQDTGGGTLSVVKLWEKYTEHKRKTLPDPRSLDKYLGLLGVWKRYFKNRASSLSEQQAFEFRDWLLKRLEPITARERIGMLRSC